MRMNKLSEFGIDFLKILTRTIDGIFSLICSLFFIYKAIRNYEISSNSWNYLVVIPLIFLFLIRLRINSDWNERVNFGALISICVLCLIFLARVEL